MARALELGSGDDEPKLNSFVQEARLNRHGLLWKVSTFSVQQVC